MAVGYAWADNFSDTQGHWAAKQISSWAEQGLAGGYSDGSFKPNAQVTRAEFVALTNRAFHINGEGSAADFSDVKSGAWYYQGVAAAKTAGYIGGYSDGTFKPNKTISRQEVATILVRLLKLKPTTEGLAAFKDADKIPEWSRSNIAAVVEHQLMNGFPDNTFKPQRNITRAGAVVSLDRAINYDSKASAEPVKPAVVEGSIAGTVTVDSQPALNAVIKVFAAKGLEVLTEAETDKDGKYEIKLDPGEYDLTATTDKDAAYKSGIKVFDSKITTANLVLSEAAVLSGELEDNGMAVKNTTVFFTTNPTFTATTNNDGQYTVVVTPDREYTIRIQDSDGETLIVEENVGSGSPGRHSIETLDTSDSDTPTIPGGGGGGSTPTDNEPDVVVNSVTFTVNGDRVTVMGNDNVFTVNLTGYEDTAMFTGLSINASDNADEAEVSLEGIVRTVTFSGGDASISVSEILGALDTGEPGVSLKSLESLAINTISITVKGNDDTQTEVTVKIEF